MVKVKPTESKNKVSIKANNSTYVYSIKDNMSEYFAKMSENWANANGLVNGTDYSSKYYAEQSKKHSENMENYIEDVETIVEDFNNTITVAESNIENIRISSIKDINSSCMLAKESLVDLAREKSEEIQDWATIIQDNAKEIASRTSFAMFDTVLKDHVLTYEESKGLALQGTYVYKEAIAGSRYGYPDFYNKCVKEYENATEEIPFIQPINPNGISSTSGFSNASNAFDGNSSTYASCGTTTDYIEWDLGESLTITGFNAKTVYVSSGARACNVAIYSVDVNGVETLLANGSGVPAESSGTCKATFSATKVTKLRFKVISADGGQAPTTQYPSRVAEINITATDSKFRKNPNGHIFYDISQKDQVDEVFTSTGMAWFYGVDTENERIFLPRNVWFEQMSMDEVGQSVEAGLPNIEGMGSATWSASITMEGALYAKSSSTTGGAYSKTAASGTREGFDASLSNPIYGNSDTVQPKAVKKLLYICVGNTVSQSTVTNVIDVTTTDNDTVPLFTGQYFDFKPNNLSWLKGGEQKNSGGVYTFCYNELVNELTNPKYGLKVINESDMIAGIDYSLYWKVNQTEMTFTTPTAINLKAYNNIAPVVGNGTALGLTNGKENVGMYGSTYEVNGKLFDPRGYGVTVGTEAVTSSTGYFGFMGVTTDATKSGIEAHLIENAEAQLYFKVANAVQNLELLDVGRIEEKLSDKVDLSNREWAINACIPDYANGIVHDMGTATSATFTAPTDGLIWISVKASGASAISKATINDNVVMQAKGVGSGYTHTDYGSFLVSKGDIIVLTSPGGGDADNGYRFFPLKGAN